MSDSMYSPDMPVGSLVKHPKNPRHRAVADTELVASIRASGIIEPLIAVEHATKYRLIAGHRRLDGAKKAGLKTVPVIVRFDLLTEGQQLEAMLNENGRRSDLTPIEEAEAFFELEQLGYKKPAIATAVGLDVKTVTTRLKLLKLSSATRRKVHGGQVTIDDALAFVEFADDPAATKRLESADASQFRWVLSQERNRRKNAAANAKRLTELVAAGATEYPNTQGYWSTAAGLPAGSINLSQHGRDAVDLASHDGCLGVVLAYPGSNYEDVVVVCTDAAKHGDTDAAAKQAAAKKRERELAEEAREEKAGEAALEVRVESAMRLAEGESLPPVLVDLVRALLPSLIEKVAGAGVAKEIYAAQMGLDAGEVWGWLYTKAERRKLDDHLLQIPDWSPARVTKALVALLVGETEQNTRYTTSGEAPMRRTWLEFLAATGHPMSKVDQQLLAEVTPDPDQPTNESDESDEVAVA